MDCEDKPPKHPFEVAIQIGGDDWAYVLRAIAEIARHLDLCGPECRLISGGGGGCHSIHIELRDITPEAYGAELRAWHEGRRDHARNLPQRQA